MPAFRRREVFRIQRFRRRYDREAGKFVFNIAYETATEITPRTISVAEGFGLGVDQARNFCEVDRSCSHSYPNKNHCNIIIPNVLTLPILFTVGLVLAKANFIKHRDWLSILLIEKRGKRRSR